MSLAIHGQRRSFGGRADRIARKELERRIGKCAILNHVKRFLISFFRGLNYLLQAPQKVIWICLGLVALNVVLDGSLMRLWSLRRDYLAIAQNIQILETQNLELKKRLQRAKDPAFLEREARDRFDLVSEGDLVFVFSEEEGAE